MANSSAPEPVGVDAPVTRFDPCVEIECTDSGGELRYPDMQPATLGDYVCYDDYCALAAAHAAQAAELEELRQKAVDLAHRHQAAAALDADMTDAPDFEALRAKRNASIANEGKRLAAELGLDGPLFCSHDPNACYCACPDGPCEHKWDGEPWESTDGCAWSVTCSRCGETSMSHSMRTGP